MATWTEHPFSCFSNGDALASSLSPQIKTPYWCEYNLLIDILWPCLSFQIFLNLFESHSSFSFCFVIFLTIHQNLLPSNQTIWSQQGLAVEQTLNPKASWTFTMLCRISRACFLGWMLMSLRCVFPWCFQFYCSFYANSPICIWMQHLIIQRNMSHILEAS